MSIQLSLIVEDRRFVEFMRPTVARIAESHAVAVSIAEVYAIHGCRAKVLVERCKSAAPKSDIIIIAADSSGEFHRGAPTTFRRKAGHLRELVTGLHPRISFAIADPCVESWLMSDPAALRLGIEAAMNAAGVAVHFRSPAAWPTPRSERAAKQALGQLIAGGIGASLPLQGFEYAGEVVGRMELENSRSASLAAWTRDFAACLRDVK